MLVNFKLFIRITSFLLFLVLSQNAIGQCAISGTLFGTINTSGWTLNQSANVTNVYGGERVTIQNTVSGAVYRISTCGASYDSQLTIFNSSGVAIGYNDDKANNCRN
ncbi:MAG: hypothetical protein FGM14_12165 [Flavobacteriales bacterium]|nr:hypothetical protein [Flavobacteriales bacterium]